MGWKEAAISAYALSVHEADELKRKRRKSKERRKMERHQTEGRNCNNSALRQQHVRAMSALTSLKR